MAVATGAERTTVSAGLGRWLHALRAVLPEGRPLPEDVWLGRHRVILWLLWLHAFAIAAVGMLMGYGLVHSLAEGGLVAAAALLASWPARSRDFRAMIASLGLVVSSSFVVHLSGGYVEMHFHFFVMVIVIALYQRWLPLLIAIAYVVLEHGTVGVLDPFAVYNHPDA
jgi:hypothetical protein